MSPAGRMELRWLSSGDGLVLLADARLQGRGLGGETLWERTLATPGHLSADGSAVLVPGSPEGLSVRDARTDRERYGFATLRTQLMRPLVPSPDGKLVLAESFAEHSFGSGLWSLSSGREVLRLENLRGWWSGLCERSRFSSDGRVLLSFGEEYSGIVRRWDLGSGIEGQPLMGHLSQVLDAACSDERWLASLDSSDQLVIWRPDGSRRRLLSGLRGRCLALSGCRRLLVVGGEGGQLGLFDPETGERLELLDAHRAPVRELAFSPDGQRLASVAEDGSVFVTALHGRVDARVQVPALFERQGPPPDEALEVLRAQLLEQELHEGVGEAHRQASLRLIERYGVRLQHTGALMSEYTCALPSPDGRYLALGTEVPVDLWGKAQGVIQIWEIASGRCVHRLEGAGDGVTHTRGRIETDLMRWSPDSTRLAVAYQMNQIAVWDALAGRGWPEIALWPDSIDLTVCFDWSPDGRELAFNVGAGEGSVGAYLLADGEFLGPDAARKLPTPGMPEDYGYRSLRWSADGERLVGYGYRTMEVRCARTGRLLVQRQEQGTSVSPDGGHVWIQETGELVETGSGQIVALQDAEGAKESCWSPDSSLLALIYSDHLEVREIPSGRRLYRLPVTPIVPDTRGYFGFQQVPLAFSRDGTRCAFFSAAGIELWSLGASPRPLALLPELDPSVGLSFDPSGQVLVSWGRTSLSFWNIDQRSRINRYDLQLPMGLDFCGDQGHPLVHARGHFGRRFEPDAAFAHPARGRWCWLGLFPSGLVVCPPEGEALLRSCASLVVGRGFGWPLHWLLGTDALELHQSWLSALSSERLPEDLPEEVRHWLLSPPAPDPGWGFTRATLPREGADIEEVELPTHHPGCYELGLALHGEALTAEALRPWLGKVVCAAAGWPKLGALVVCRPDSIQLATTHGYGSQSLPLAWAGPARFLPDARVLGAVKREQTLSGKRCWVQDPHLQVDLAARGAVLDPEIGEHTELVILVDREISEALQQADRYNLPCVVLEHLLELGDELSDELS